MLLSAIEKPLLVPILNPSRALLSLMVSKDTYSTHQQLAAWEPCAWKQLEDGDCASRNLFIISETQKIVLSIRNFYLCGNHWATLQPILHLEQHELHTCNRAMYMLIQASPSHSFGAMV